MFETTERRRLSDIVANRIYDFVVQNRLRPGDRLPTELELAQQFGVSRVSIREATKALGFLGFLEATPRRGTTVGQIDLRRITQFLELHPSLREATPQDLIDARTVFELGVMPYLKTRMQQDESLYPKLAEYVVLFQSVDDLGECLELDRRFHTELMVASGVSPLLMFHELLMVFSLRIHQQIQDEDQQARILADLKSQAEDHQVIIDCLRDGDIERAQDELKAHIGHQKTQLQLQA